MRCLPLYLCAAVHAAAAQHGNRQHAEPLHEPLARAVRAHIMEYGEVHTIDDAYDELGVMSTFYPDKWAELLAADASSKLDAAAAEMAQGDAWLCWPDGLSSAGSAAACVTRRVGWGVWSMLEITVYPAQALWRIASQHQSSVDPDLAADAAPAVPAAAPTKAKAAKSGKGGWRRVGRGGAAARSLWDDLPPKEQASVDALREIVDAQSGADGTAGLRARALATGLVLNDHTLSRYLRAMEWKLVKGQESCIEQIHETIRWREKREMRMLTAAERKAGQTGPHDPAFYNGRVDQGASTVLIARPNALDTRDHKDFVARIERATELAVQSVDAADGPVDQIVLVIDLERANLRAMKQMWQGTSPMFATLRAHYPERLATVRVVHFAKFMMMMWRWIRPFLPKRLQALIHFYTDLPPFLEYYGKGHAEERFGGDLPNVTPLIP